MADGGMLPLSLDSLVLHESYTNHPQDTAGYKLNVDITYRYPKGDTLLVQLFNRIFFGDSTSRMSPQEALKSYIAEAKSEYLDGLDSLYEEDEPREIYVSNIKISNSVRYQQGNLIVIAKESDYYQARSAHGIGLVTYYNIDRQTHNLLSEGDLFVEGYQPELTRLLRKYLAREQKENKDLEMVEAADVEPNDNFALSDKGITYHFNPYDAAPYAVGHIEIFIPYEELAGIAKPGTILSQFLPHDN